MGRDNGELGMESFGSYDILEGWDADDREQEEASPSEEDAQESEGQDEEKPDWSPPQRESRAPTTPVTEVPKRTGSQKRQVSPPEQPARKKRTKATSPADPVEVPIDQDALLRDEVARHLLRLGGHRHHGRRPVLRVRPDVGRGTEDVRLLPHLA